MSDEVEILGGNWGNIAGKNSLINLKSSLCGVKLQIIQTTYPKKKAMIKKKTFKSYDWLKILPLWYDLGFFFIFFFFLQARTDWKASVYETWRSSQRLRVSSAQQQHECTSTCCPHVAVISTARPVARLSALKHTHAWAQCNLISWTDVYLLHHKHLDLLL